MTPSPSPGGSLFGSEDTDLRFVEPASGGTGGWRQLKEARPDTFKSPLRARAAQHPVPQPGKLLASYRIPRRSASAAASSAAAAPPAESAEEPQTPPAAAESAEPAAERRPSPPQSPAGDRRSEPAPPPPEAAGWRPLLPDPPPADDRPASAADRPGESAGAGTLSVSPSLSVLESVLPVFPPGAGRANKR